MTSIMYQDGKPETLRRAQEWIKQYAESATIEILIADSDHRKLRHEVNLRKHAERMEKQ